MKLHGGMFEIASKLREGTQVTVIFPRSRVMMTEPGASVSTAA
jgi:signal transduction histidine kinase